MDKKEDISTRENKPEAAPHGSMPRRKVYVWTALVLALAAWLVLWFGDGYVSIAVAALACVFGFLGASRNDSAIRRLAVAALIAAIVLIVVVASYLVVLKIGLRV